MRLALRYLMTEHHALERNAVYTTWIGHDGRSGLKRHADGKKEILTGVGIGNNYWDLLPFGNLDCYATIQYYDAVRTLARIEKEIISHPEWSVPRGAFSFDSDMLERHSALVKAEGNHRFWNNEPAGLLLASIRRTELTTTGSLFSTAKPFTTTLPLRSMRDRS